MIGAIVGLGIGAITSYMAAQEEQSSRDAMRERLREAMISEAEQSKLELGINKTYNANIAQQANQMAFTSRGTDSGIATAAMLGQAEGSRLNALSGLERDVMSVNKNLESQAAGVPDVNVIDSTAAGAITGAQVGNQISTLLKYQDQLELLKEQQTKKDTPKPEGSAAPIENFPMPNFQTKATQGLPEINALKGIDPFLSVGAQFGQFEQSVAPATIPNTLPLIAPQKLYNGVDENTVNYFAPPFTNEIEGLQFPRRRFGRN